MHKGFPVKLNLRIDWSDLDLVGHVNNVMFLKYIQAARVNYWEKMGLYQHYLNTQQGPMLAAVNCQYKKPLFYPGEVVVYTRVKSIGNTSFSFQHLLVDEEGTVAAEVEDIMVMYDFKKHEKILFSQEFRNNVSAIEGKEL